MISGLFILLFTVLAQAQSPASLACEKLGTAEDIRGQGQILQNIVGFDSSSELKNQKFKHLTQYSLFLNELKSYLAVKALARGTRLPQEQEAGLVVQTSLQFMKDEGFLNPKSVCECAKGNAQMTVSSRFAKCIVQQFKPTMYNDPETYDFQ